MKSLRKFYWLTTEFFKRHHTLIYRVIAAVVVLSLITVALIRVVPAPRTHIRVGIVGKFTPETLPTSIQSQLSQGLVGISHEGNPEPGLAAKWEVLDNEKTYVFHLDPNLKWDNGDPVLGDDISYNFRDVEIQKSESTVTFRLKEPFSPFFYAVSRPILKNGRYGTGRYKLAGSVIYSGVLQSITLVSPKEKISYKFYPTETSALTAFKLGEIDKLDNISYVPSDITSDPRIEVADAAGLSKIAVIFFNNNDSLLTSKSARQGLAYAIEDKAFGHSRTLSPIASSSWAYNDLVKDYAYDPDKAKTIFAQDLENTAVTIELKTTLQYLDIAEQIASDWRRVLGVLVNVKVVTTVTSDYQALLADYTPPTDPDQYTIWHSTQPGNFTHYANLKVDKLLEDGRRTSDRKLRKEIYQDFQRFLLEDSPAVFLFDTSAYQISRLPIFSR